MLLRCGRCKTFKSQAEFYKSSAPGRGFQNRCKDCTRLTARDNYAKYRERRKAAQKKYTLTRPEQIMRQCARQAGLDPDEVQEKFKAHDGLCDICGERADPGFNRRHVRLEIDHDHNAVGVLRGFLCHYCNAGLGWFKDDPVRLAAAIQYLAERAAPATAA